MSNNGRYQKAAPYRFNPMESDILSKRPSENKSGENFNDELSRAHDKAFEFIYRNLIGFLPRTESTEELQKAITEVTDLLTAEWGSYDPYERFQLTPLCHTLDSYAFISKVVTLYLFLQNSVLKNSRIADIRQWLNYSLNAISYFDRQRHDYYCMKISEVIDFFSVIGTTDKQSGHIVTKAVSDGLTIYYLKRNIQDSDINRLFLHPENLHMCTGTGKTAIQQIYDLGSAQKQSEQKDDKKDKESTSDKKMLRLPMVLEINGSVEERDRVIQHIADILSPMGHRFLIGDVPVKSMMEKK